MIVFILINALCGKFTIKYLNDKSLRVKKDITLRLKTGVASLWRAMRSGLPFF